MINNTAHFKLLLDNYKRFNRATLTVEIFAITSVNPDENVLPDKSAGKILKFEKIQNLPALNELNFYF